MPAVTLWKIGPFRRVICRDYSGKCFSHFAWIEWLSSEELKLDRDMYKDNGKMYKEYCENEKIRKAKCS